MIKLVRLGEAGQKGEDPPDKRIGFGRESGKVDRAGSQSQQIVLYKFLFQFVVSVR
jgi:hypothetical protein